MSRNSASVVIQRANAARQNNSLNDDSHRSSELVSTDMELSSMAIRLPRNSESTMDDVFFATGTPASISTVNLKQSRPSSCAVPITNVALHTSEDSLLYQVQRSAKRPTKAPKESKVIDAASSKSSRPVSVALSVASAASRWDSVESSSVELQRAARNGSRRGSGKRQSNSRSHTNISAAAASSNADYSITSNSTVNVNSVSRNSGSQRSSMRHRSHSRESSLTRLSSFLRESFRKLRRSRSATSMKSVGAAPSEAGSNLAATVCELNAAVGGLERQRSIARLAGAYVVRSRSPSPNHSAAPLPLAFAQRTVSTSHVAASASGTPRNSANFSVQNLNLSAQVESRHCTLPRKSEQLVPARAHAPSSKQATQPATGTGSGCNTLPRSGATSKLANPKILASNERSPDLPQPTPLRYNQAPQAYYSRPLPSPPVQLSPRIPPRDSFDEQLMRAFGALETIVRSNAQRNGAKRIMLATDYRQQLAVGKEHFRARLRNCEKRVSHFQAPTPLRAASKKKRAPPARPASCSSDRYCADTAPQQPAAQALVQPSSTKRHSQVVPSQPKLVDLSKQVLVFRRAAPNSATPQPVLASQPPSTSVPQPVQLQQAHYRPIVPINPRVGELSRPLRQTKSVSESVYDNLPQNTPPQQRPITVTIPTNSRASVSQSATNDLLLVHSPSVKNNSPINEKPKVAAAVSVKTDASATQPQSQSRHSEPIVFDRKISSQIAPKADASAQRPVEPRPAVVVKPILSFPLGRCSPCVSNGTSLVEYSYPGQNCGQDEQLAPVSPSPRSSSLSESTESSHYAVPKGQLVSKLREMRVKVPITLPESSNDEYVNVESLSLTVSISPPAGSCAPLGELESPRCDDDGITHERMSSSTSSGVSSNEMHRNGDRRVQRASSHESEYESDSGTETESGCESVLPAVDDSTLKKDKEKREEADALHRRSHLRKAASWPSLACRTMRRSRSCVLSRFARFAFSYDKRRLSCNPTSCGS